MLKKPKKCCDFGTNEHCVPMCIRGRVVGIDLCIAKLVASLEAGGFGPVASCCGHGKLPPSVIIENDMWILVLTREQGEETINRYCTRTDVGDD